MHSQGCTFFIIEVILRYVDNLIFSGIITRYLSGLVIPSLKQNRTFDRWLADGCNAGMTYLTSERHLAPRRDPRLLFPDLQSIVCFAFAYPPPAEDLAPGSGRAAAYACQPDYHPILTARVDEFMRALNERSPRPIRWMSFCDSAAVPERSLAALAGLGWIGRSGNLIHPRHGSYLLLAEAYTDAPAEDLAALGLPAGQPLPDRCGTCRRCVDACPTGSIRPDRTVDARRCISYLTIEHKGEIPTDLAGLLGEHVFGCDVCQRVCPWNNHSSECGTVDVSLDLADLLRLTPSEFKIRFADSALLRPRRRGLLRNVCAVAANLGAVELIPLIEVLLSDEEEIVRAAASAALGRLRGGG